MKFSLSGRRVSKEEYEIDRTNYVYRGNVDPSFHSEVQHSFTVVFNVGGFSGIPLPFFGSDSEDVRERFIKWLNESDWQTIELADAGASSFQPFSFRTANVHAIQIYRG